MISMTAESRTAMVNTVLENITNNISWFVITLDSLPNTSVEFKRIVGLDGVHWWLSRNNQHGCTIKLRKDRVMGIWEYMHMTGDELGPVAQCTNIDEVVEAWDCGKSPQAKLEPRAVQPLFQPFSKIDILHLSAIILSMYSEGGTDQIEFNNLEGVSLVPGYHNGRGDFSVGMCVGFRDAGIIFSVSISADGFVNVSGDGFDDFTGVTGEIHKGIFRALKAIGHVSSLRLAMNFQDYYGLGGTLDVIIKEYITASLPHSLVRVKRLPM